MLIFCSPVSPMLLPSSEPFPVPWCCWLWRDPIQGWHTPAQVIQMPFMLHFSTSHCWCCARVLLASSVIWESQWRSEVILPPFLCYGCDHGVGTVMGESCNVGWCSLQCIFWGGKTSSSVVPCLLGYWGLAVGPAGHVGQWHLSFFVCSDRCLEKRGGEKSTGKAFQYYSASVRLLQSSYHKHINLVNGQFANVDNIWWIQSNIAQKL